MLRWVSRMAYNLVMFHGESLCKLSKAFLKSLILIFSDIWNSKLYSTILLRIKICSVHERSLTNPAYSCRNISSIAALILCSKIVQDSLLGTDSSATPLQLLQSLVFSFLEFSLSILSSILLGLILLFNKD